MQYNEFLNRKRQLNGMFGFKAIHLPDSLFDYQKYLVDWELMKGRGALFADTGTGKTPMEMVIADNIVRHTNKPVLILTPLAVAHQFVTEGEKFGIEIKRSKDGKPAGDITVANYQQLHKFNPNDFAGCVCDESSVIKNSVAQTRLDLTRFMNKMPYRCLATATPSPNDYVELGSSSEALGELAYMDMVAQFFRDTSNDKNPQWSTPKYVLKGHAAKDFWRWVSSWARAMRKPSDLGFDDSRFILPELIMNEHVLQVTEPLPGELFVRKAVTLKDQRNERKMTINARVEKVAELVKNHPSSIIWGHYDYETELMAKVIPDSIEVSGKDSDDAKEEKFIAFETGQVKRMIIKPKIGAFGLNWQHCGHQTFFPSHSYEQWYQGVRRSWRYGRKGAVTIDMVTTEGELGVMQNIKRKSEDAIKQFEMLVKYMNDELKIERETKTNNIISLPKWI